MSHVFRPIATTIVCLLLTAPAPAQIVSTLAGPFSASGDIAVDTAGNIYVADYGDQLPNANGTTVYKVTPAGAVSVFATGLSGASGNEFGPDGTLYQSNIAIGVVSKIDSSGNVTSFSTGHAGPVGVALDDDGNLYVANCGNSTIQKVTPAGVRTTLVSGNGLSCPNGLTFAEDGNLYTCNFNNGSIFRIGLDGSIELFAIAPGANNGHLTYSHGALWVVSRGGNRIFRYDLDGNRIKVAGFNFRGNTDGDRSVATFSLPNGIGVSPDGTKLYTNSVEAIVGADLNPILVREIDLTTVLDAPAVAALGEELSVRSFPNPARPRTRIEYVLVREAEVTLKVYDLLGREVRTLVHGRLPPGRRSVNWDGTDPSGRPLAAGVYLYTLRAGGEVATERMLLLR